MRPFVYFLGRPWRFGPWPLWHWGIRVGWSFDLGLIRIGWKRKPIIRLDPTPEPLMWDWPT